jgi:HlyD family secretion protein
MAMSRQKKSVLVLAVLAAVLLAVLLKPDPVEVDVATVAKRTLIVMLEEQGKTRAHDPYIVTAPVTGRLLRTQLDEGMQVAKEELIARIALPPEDSRTEAVSRANLAAAEARHAAVTADVMEAETAFAQAMAEQQRRDELFKINLASAEEQELYRQATDAAQARLLRAQASVQAAAAEVESARSLLLGLNGDSNAGIRNITAPVTGTIYRVFEENERVVQAGTPLLAISNADALELVVDLLTQDAVQVKPGNTIIITGWGGDESLFGTVSYIEPQAFTKISALGVEEQRVNVIGEFLQTPEALGAEYRIDAGIVVWEGDGVLTVPGSAIFQRNNRWYTFTVNDGRAAERELEIGKRNRDYVQILAGLAEDETVVLFPSELLNEGTKVVYRNTGE